jgi:hypothetical protein
MMMPVAIIGRYVGLPLESGFVQAGVASDDNQIRLLGGQFKMGDSRLTTWVFLFLGLGIS